MDVLHTALEVTDLETTRAFYEELLGLELTREYEAGGQRNYYVAGRAGTELQFREVEGPIEPSGIEHVAVASDDVDATVESAVAEFDSTVEREPQDLDRKPIRIAAITDPDGYTVHVIQQR